MALSKAQKAKLKAAGFNARDIADVEASMEEEEEEPRGRRDREVFVLRGREADEFLAGFNGAADDEPEPDDDEEEEEEEEAPAPKRKRSVKVVDDVADDEADEKPPAAARYFK